MMAKELKTAAELVAAGAALLDEKGPEGWRSRIGDKLTGHDMWDPDLCVLCRVYGDYNNGLIALGLLDDSMDGVPAAEHGFEAFGNMNLFEALAAEWLKEAARVPELV